MSVFSFSLSTPVYLENTVKNVGVVYFKNGLEGTAEFSSQYQHIKTVMENIGIDIPLSLSEQYGLNAKKRRIYLMDPLFGKAFYEIYFKMNMDPEIFKWKKYSQ